MDVYNKIFTKILDSSIWLEPVETRVVWITLIAAMNEDGYAHFSSIENLSNRALVNLSATKRAIKCLEGPDAQSADPANEGRRIERVPGGWIVLNAEKYRGIVTREHAKNLTRERVRKFRSKNGVSPQPLTQECNAHVTACNEAKRLVTPSEAVSDSEANTVERESNGFPKIEVVLTKASMVGCTPDEAEKFYHHFEAAGWIDRNGHPIKSWISKLVTWTANAREKKEKEKNGNNRSYGQKPAVKPNHDEGF